MMQNFNGSPSQPPPEPPPAATPVVVEVKPVKESKAQKPKV